MTAQIEAVLEDFAVAAIKIGMLVAGQIALGVAERALREGAEPRLSMERGAAPKGRMRAFLVYDPVMIASSGDALSGAGFVEAIWPMGCCRSSIA